MSETLPPVVPEPDATSPPAPPAPPFPTAAASRRPPRLGRWFGELGSVLVPFLPGAVIVVATVFAYQHAAGRQVAVMNALSESEAGRVQAELVRGLDARAAAIERLAAARAAGGDAWRETAGTLAQGELQFRAVLVFDSSHALVETVPADARLFAIADPRDDEARATAIDAASEADDDRATTVTTVPLTDGGRELLACAPVVRDGRRSGWIVGVIRVRDLLDADLAGALRRGFSVGVFESQTLVYGAKTDDAGDGVQYARDAAAVRGPLLWRLEVWPAEELTRRLESQGPAGLFLAGMACAWFVAVTVFLWRERRALPREG